jgi:hypothetical protein
MEQITEIPLRNLHNHEECRLPGYETPVHILTGDILHLRYKAQLVNTM